MRNKLLATLSAITREAPLDHACVPQLADPHQLLLAVHAEPGLGDVLLHGSMTSSFESA